MSSDSRSTETKPLLKLIYKAVIFPDLLCQVLKCPGAKPRYSNINGRIKYKAYINLCWKRERNYRGELNYNSQEFPVFNASAKRAAAAKANRHQVFFLSTSEQISYEIPPSLPHFFISLEKRSRWRMFHCRNGFKCNLNEPHICLPAIFFCLSLYPLFFVSSADSQCSFAIGLSRGTVLSSGLVCVWKRVREGGGVAVENRNLLLDFHPSFALHLLLSHSASLFFYSSSHLTSRRDSGIYYCIWMWMGRAWGKLAVTFLQWSIFGDGLALSDAATSHSAPGKASLSPLVSSHTAWALSRVQRPQPQLYLFPSKP